MANVVVKHSYPAPAVLCGASGVGKDSLLDRLVQTFPHLFAKAVSHTTRPMRPSEVDGVAYHFITQHVFEDLAKGEFVERVFVHGNHYGMSQRAIRDVSVLGKTPLLILDYHGLEQLVKQNYNPLAILVRGPALPILEQRLRHRGDKADAIATRMETARDELQYFDKNPDKFQVTVHNIDTLDGAFVSLCAQLNLPCPVKLARVSATSNNLLTSELHALSSAQYVVLTPFLVASTACFDSSHGWEHARDVWQLTVDIVTVQQEQHIEEDVLGLAAILHDICDHKYLSRGSIAEGARDEFVLRVLRMNPLLTADLVNAKAHRIRALIDAVSWSKQDKARTLHQPEAPTDMSEQDRRYLDILRDADRLTALGLVNGIGRCRAYVQALHPDTSDADVTKLVVQHCHDKLLRMLPEKFIVTCHGQALAAPLHQELVEWVQRTNSPMKVV